MATPSKKHGSSKVVATVEETTVLTTATATTTSTTTTTTTTTTIAAGKDAKTRPVLAGTPSGFLAAADARAMAGVTLLALLVRGFYLSHPHQAVFDEIPTGDYISQYIKGTFFLDIDPPFGKLLLAGVARLFGYDGQFDFSNIGATYLGHSVPFVELRLFSVLLGALLAPIAYATIKAANLSSTAALLASLMVAFDHALITESRYIVLDPILLFLAGATLMAYTIFRRYDEHAFTGGWWSWLGVTGTFLALTISTKRSGLFLLGTLVTATLGEFYRLLGDRRVGLCQLGRHVLARAVAYVAIPALVYLACYEAHFRLLHQHTHSAQMMSVEYRSTLSNGTTITPTMPQEVSFGSEVSIQHADSHSYLHSHEHYYPGGSHQQQVTVYQHDDIFNTWRVERFQQTETPYDQQPPLPIYNGERIRLLHKMTNCRLHSHEHKAPMTENEHHKEVSAYGFPNFPGDSNDDWIIEVVDYDRRVPQAKRQIMALHTYFRLRHANLGCYLSSHNAVLPSWGFGQGEVTCIRDGNPKNLVWRITAHHHPTMPADAPVATVATPSFWSKLRETHKAMASVSRNLADKIHPEGSRPSAWWPLLRKGVTLVESPLYAIRVLGNLPIWLCSSLSVLVWCLLQLVLVLRDQRGYKDTWHGYRLPIMNMGGLLAIGWIAHFVPYFTMERPLFLNEYLPGFYYSLLLSCVLLDTAFRSLNALSSHLSHALLTVLALAMVATFWLLSPWIYGLPVSASYCERARLLSFWKWDCPAATESA
ncbi:Dolichyl-phosphate-mannose-protein mannosyltransferase-domain-containing protein [Syncephalis pseudoplumigaleata]|uniref:Dolichyl-phosphate-mannose--protein mannosyltransferase n=2 Tax=Zoopagomycota TaxID=1913638 RepID=A0A4P9ZNL1_9FUNG|nr:Dolichyl-phosphate-mannose-protein mannosyltransferase-domain-containing protein [Syncephalis pseudoplumigaleata]RKP34132.1 Dolichyl-phosphate-mannose-protein mannosyltransferase-domain-containing protein [Dimargaris cristalligena]|eukprot:RKP27669.1 Dolichyl-phosphate-mannose-protein mannosyltransferase-domain-containing protein [Syncephalis pseudoplumigaleata]